MNCLTMRAFKDSNNFAINNTDCIIQHRLDQRGTAHAFPGDYSLAVKEILQETAYLRSQGYEVTLNIRDSSLTLLHF